MASNRVGAGGAETVVAPRLNPAVGGETEVDAMSFRASRYINFGAGTVLIQPMDLSRSRPSPRSLEDMLDLFECRVDVWQLGPAVEILKNMESAASFGPSIWAHSAYALIAVLFTYFEMIGKTLNPCSEPSGTASRDFNHGFCDVYPMYDTASGDRSDKALPEVVEFRNRVRNGLYHLGYTKGNLFIHNEPRDRTPHDFMVDGGGAAVRYLVNPHQMARTIVAHFAGFMGRLRNPAPEFDELRTRFERFFVEFHGLH